MRQVNIKSLLLLVTTLLSTAQPIYAEDNAIPASTMVTAQEPENVNVDAAKTIFVTHAKPDFVIKLPANPTTGYSWFTQHYDDRLLTLKKQTYVAPSPAIPGKGGFTVWQFQANPSAFDASYVSEIKLIYARPWELDKGQVTAFKIVTSSDGDSSR